MPSENTHQNKLLKTKKRSTTVGLKGDVGEEQGNHKKYLVLIKQLQDRVQHGEEENHQNFTIPKGAVVAHQGGHAVN